MITKNIIQKGSSKLVCGIFVGFLTIFGWLATAHNVQAASIVELSYVSKSAGSEGSSIGLSVVGTKAYVSAGENGMLIFDVSNSLNPPVLIGHVYQSIYPGTDPGVITHRPFAVSNIVYRAEQGGGLQMSDVSNPSSPQDVGSLWYPSSAEGVEVRNNLAYVAWGGNGGLRIVDVTQANNPAFLGAIENDYAAEGPFTVTLKNNLAIVAWG